MPWRQTETIESNGGSSIQWTLENLESGKTYEYRLWFRTRESNDFIEDGSYTFRTQPLDAQSISFALMSDAHITPGRMDRSRVLSTISERIAAGRPDFVVMLGDNIQTFDSHGGPIRKPNYGPLLYKLFRKGLGDMAASQSCYYVIGNWEGENGWHSVQQRAWARAARMQFIPNPLTDTYPQGGSADGDYYAFTWGNLLCIILNVTGYTPIDHSYGSGIGGKDDWTLGKEQKHWLLQTLTDSREKNKIICIHHPVGGGSPDDRNARYGRGGGLAANIGEQADLHQWMRQFGVQALFYGHDHVFTDNVVDGIHYICVGSAGAPWMFTRVETGYDKYWTSYGYTWVDTHADGLTVSFVDLNGEILQRIPIIYKK